MTEPQGDFVTQSSASTERRTGAVGLPRDGICSAAPDLLTFGLLDGKLCPATSGVMIGNSGGGLTADRPPRTVRIMEKHDHNLTTEILRNLACAICYAQEGSNG